jgi:AraC-like DNA-binding protein
MKDAALAPPSAARAKIASRKIAAGRDWEIRDVVCRAGPEDRPYEEQHERVSISAVVAGSFRYACEAGAALLYPGSLMLGNAGTCFECGHQHSRGDRCISIHLDRALFEEVAASAAASSRFRFALPMLPAMADLVPTLVEIEALGERARAMAGESLVLKLAERVGEAASGALAKRAQPAPGDERRISAALHHIEAHADEALDIETLARLAAMSKFHFLRVFRRVTGITPYKYLLGVRMRRAAVRLATTREAVAAIAFEAGFGDLSTFNNRFRSAFGRTPTQFREG